MDPTLHDEEKIFVNKFEELNRGDIVIIRGDEKNYVKISLDSRNGLGLQA